MGRQLQTIKCSLPEYDTDHRTWRREILSCAREAVGPRKWNTSGPFEVVVTLYFTAGTAYDKHDIDNRLKDVLDGLQGAFFVKAKGKTRHKNRVIRNDRSVCRAVVEERELPKSHKNNDSPPGGRLLIRPYEIGRKPITSNRFLKESATGQTSLAIAQVSP